VSAIELELKLDARPEDLPAIRAWLAAQPAASGKPRVQRLDNRYFDTPERHLAHSGMALRLRRSGRGWVQTLKAGAAPGALSARREWEQPVPGPALALAALARTPLGTLGSARQLRQRLQPVFDAQVRREAWPLRLADGTTVELAIDTGLLRATPPGARRPRRAPLCEIELELVDGDAQALLDFAALLAQQWLLLPQPLSKAARGYRLADAAAQEPAAQPAKVQLPALDRAAPTAHALADALAAMQQALLHDCAHAASDDIEFVHQARVALRRLRSALRAFAKPAGLARRQWPDAALRTLGRLLGAARDWDVFTADTLPRLARWLGEAGESHAAEALAAAARRQRAQAREALAAHLRAPAHGQTMLALEACIWRLRQQRGGAAFARSAAEVLARRHRAVLRRCERLAHRSAEELHRLRIEVKRLRYGLDLCAGLYAQARLAPYREALAALQDELGRLNDDAVAHALLKALQAPDALRQRHAERCAQRRLQRLPAIAADATRLALAACPWDGD
jgi:inorganic triphosphatase YgiF